MNSRFERVMVLAGLVAAELLLGTTRVWGRTLDPTFKPGGVPHVLSRSLDLQNWEGRTLLPGSLRTLVLRARRNGSTELSGVN